MDKAPVVPLPVTNKVALIHIVKRKVLFARTRGKELFYTCGGKPKGKAKSKESDVDALIREIKEELSVKLNRNSIRFLASFSGAIDGKRDGSLVIVKCFTASFAGKPKPSSEIKELAWFTCKDAHRTTSTGKQILIDLHKRGLID